MDNALLFLKDNAVAVGIVLTIVGLIGGAIGASVRFLIDSKKIENEKKALRQQMITNNIAPMRQAWINEVRQKSAELLADFHLILYGKISKNNKTQLSIIKDSDILDLMTTIQYKSSYLSLLLPLSTEKKPEEKSKQIAKHLNILTKMTALPNDKVVKEQVNKELRECIQAIKELIKDEWEVTKSLKEIE
ncbi:TPA: hypothetical protein ACS772_000855 [Providencia alcalifaciens]